MSGLSTAKSNRCRSRDRKAACVQETALVRSFSVLPREISRPPTMRVVGNRWGRKNEAMKGREKSDGCVVPEGSGNRVPIAETRGGKAATDIERTRSEGLRRGTAGQPKPRSTPGATVFPGEVTLERVATYERATPAGSHSVSDMARREAHA